MAAHSSSHICSMVKDCPKLGLKDPHTDEPREYYL